MQALALNGQAAAALAQYENCRQILEEELGVEPTTITQQLAADIRAGKVQSSGTRPAANLNSNLPGSLTPFIGRRAELAAVIEQLTEGDGGRLITITGPGGMGKTRLAQEVGRYLLAEPPAELGWEGIWFVSLIGIRAAENVPVAVANTLGLTLPNEEKAATAVIRQLSQRRLLLILDNFELLLDSSPWLLELMQGAAGVRLLVTSREELGLAIEQGLALRGLAVPPEGEAHTQALDYDASRLFLDRARRLYKAFRVTAENWPSIVGICRLTEGLPLGIELAATLLAESGPAEIVARIMADVAVLAADYLDIAPHQRSIYLVFEQSWGRLSAAEQRVLSRLSIFEGDGFSQRAALQVAGAEGHVLRSLVRKSLVQGYTADRYSLHPLYKVFAAGKLPAERAELHQAHAAYFASLLAEAVPAVFDKEKYLRLRALLPLLPDLRACWAWSVAAADMELIDGLAWPLHRLLRETAQLQEGRVLFEKGWQQLQGRWPAQTRGRRQQTTLAHLASYLGFFHLFCGDIYAARPCLEYALAEFDRLNLPQAQKLPRTALIDIMDRLGKYEARLMLCQQGLQAAEAGNDALAVNDALGNLGAALYDMGRLAEARAIFLRTIETATADVPDASTAITMNNLGLTELALGNLGQARAWLEQSLHIRQQYGNSHRVGAALRALGLLAITEGDYGAARQQLETALEQYTQSGRVDGLGPVYLVLAQLALTVGDLAAAEQAIRRALAYAVELQLTAQGLNGLWHWGQYLWAAGRRDQALTLLGYLLGHKNTSGFLVWEINNFLTVNHVSLESVSSSRDVDWQVWLQSNYLQ
jgi:predicted ATPase/Tfp pilus assembly protein PilF